MNNFNTIVVNNNNEIRYIANGHNFKTFNIDQNLNSSSLSNIIYSPTYNNVLTINNYGNIGIGSTNPRYQLDIPYTVNTKNIITDGYNISNINASNINYGLINTSIIPTTYITSGQYGSTNENINLTIDNYGRIININNNTINIPYNQISGLSQSATIDTTNAFNITTGILNISRLPVPSLIFTGDASSITNINASNITLGTLNLNIYPTSTVIQGVYGSSTNSLTLSVDTYGRIISITNVTISQTDVNNSTNATNFTSGIISTSRLNTSGITNVGTYGSFVNTLTIRVDTYGRVTSIANNQLTIQNTQIIGLSTSSFRDTTSATNITSGYSLANINTLNSINARYIGSALNISNINVKNISSISLSYFPTSGVIDSMTNVSPLKLTSISVDIYGRIINVSPILIDATNISTGMLNVNRIPTVSNVSGIYGSSINSIGLTIDQYGRITSIQNIRMSLSCTNIYGLPISSSINITNVTNIGTNIQNNLSIGNTSQNIILNANTLNYIYANNMYTLYNNLQYNYPVYYNYSFLSQSYILIPVKYFKSTNIYNTSDIKVYLTIDNGSLGSPWKINMNGTITSSNFNTTNVVSVANNEEQFISTGSSGSTPSISYTNTTVVPNTTGLASCIINNISLTGTPIFINIHINGMDANSSIYSVESLYYKDNIDTLTRSYASGMLLSNAAKYLYIEINNSSAYITGNYSVINYY